MSELQEQNKRLETQALSVQHRLANLQVCDSMHLLHRPNLYARCHTELMPKFCYNKVQLSAAMTVTSVSREL